MKALLATMLVALLSACGGGGSVRPDPPLSPPTVLRTDLLLGYYFGNAATANETADHANLFWSGYAEGVATQIEGLNAARANGQRVVLMIPPGIAEADVAAYLRHIKAAGPLWNGVVALYYYDEPDVNGISDEQVIASNVMLRRVMTEFPELAGTKIAVFYGCATGGRPGLSSYDWIGCDDYGQGCNVLNGGVAELRSLLGPSQRLMLIPGGASPWQQNPTCFEVYAHANPVVVAIVGFLWQSVSDRGSTFAGIRDNGMATAYRALGKRMMGRT